MVIQEKDLTVAWLRFASKYGHRGTTSGPESFHRAVLNVAAQPILVLSAQSCPETLSGDTARALGNSKPAMSADPVSDTNRVEGRVGQTVDYDKKNAAGRQSKQHGAVWPVVGRRCPFVWVWSVPIWLTVTSRAYCVFYLLLVGFRMSTLQHIKRAGRDFLLN
jgi:hypothetical protein